MSFTQLSHAPKTAFTLALLGTSISACVPDFDDQQALISSCRVLAVRSSPAEATPKQLVELSVLVAGPSEHDSRADDVSWALCLARKPLTELGPVAEACVNQFGANAELLSSLGQGQQVAATIPADACKLFGPQRPPAGEDGIAGRAVDPDLSGGYHQPVVLEAGDVSLASVRISCGAVGLPNAELIRFNQGYRTNENPKLERLELLASDEARTIAEGLDAPGITVPVGAQVELRAVWASCPRRAVCGDGLCTAGENQVNCAEDCRTNPRGCTGAESYLWANPEKRTVQERREGIGVAWFATAGRFVDEQTGRTETDPDGADTSNRWTAPDAPGLVRLWVVLRDDRGGVGWKQYLVSVEAR